MEFPCSALTAIEMAKKAEKSKQLADRLNIATLNTAETTKQIADWVKSVNEAQQDEYKSRIKREQEAMQNERRAIKIATWSFWIAAGSLIVTIIGLLVK